MAPTPNRHLISRSEELVDGDSSSTPAGIVIAVIVPIIASILLVGLILLVLEYFHRRHNRHEFGPGFKLDGIKRWVAKMNDKQRTRRFALQGWVDPLRLRVKSNIRVAVSELKSLADEAGISWEQEIWPLKQTECSHCQITVPEPVAEKSL